MDLIGKQVSHYRILEKIGEGGMGEVYKAQDTHLDRTAALKFLSSRSVGNEADRRRFLREAQSASSLDHPNICTVYDIEETDDAQYFIAMAYLQGNNLRDLMNREQMEPAKAIDIVRQVARGLNQSHRQGIVHRDIKPENLYVTTDNTVKILDFGLAKLQFASQITQDGTRMGTVHYMSPEQATGGQLDHRTDVWSLGVVLYELLTGKRPFEGEYQQAILYGIINSTPDSVSKIRPDIPVALATIVEKCLEKDPGKRYQHMSALLRELDRFSGKHLSGDSQSQRKWGVLKGAVLIVFLSVVAVAATWWMVTNHNAAPGPEESRIKKIAVLYFENRGSPEDNYFVEGISDAIATKLVTIANLGVIATESILHFKDSTLTPQEIGQELDVDYVLTGAIQREHPGDAASRIRISPKLIDVQTNTYLWAHTYDETITDSFRVQSEISEHVAQAMDLSLAREQVTRMRNAPTTNMDVDVYERYLRARILFISYPIDWRYQSQVSDELEQVVAQYPSFQEAWCMLTKTYIRLSYSSRFDYESMKQRAATALEKARQLDSGSRDFLVASGAYKMHIEGNFEQAISCFEKALTLQPNDSETLAFIGDCNYRIGKIQIAFKQYERSLELDPFNPSAILNVGFALIEQREYDRAEQVFERMYLIAPKENKPFPTIMVIRLLRDGDIEGARKIYRTAPDVVSPALIRHGVIMFADLRILRDDVCPAMDSLLLDRADPAMNIALMWGCAELCLTCGNPEEADLYWRALVQLIEKKYPDAEKRSVFVQAKLAIAYTQLDRVDEAVQIAGGFDSYYENDVKPGYIAGLRWAAALIYLRSCRYEAAIDQLEQAIALSGWISPALLRIDPLWDPLRENPRFQKLMEDRDLPNPFDTWKPRTRS